MLYPDSFSCYAYSTIKAPDKGEELSKRFQIVSLTAYWNAALMRPDRFKAVFCMSVPYVPRGDVSVQITSLITSLNSSVPALTVA